MLHITSMQTFLLHQYYYTQAELATSWYNSFKCFYAAIQMLLLAKQDNKMYTKVYSEILICP